MIWLCVICVLQPDNGCTRVNQDVNSDNKDVPCCEGRLGDKNNTKDDTKTRKGRIGEPKYQRNRKFLLLLYIINLFKVLLVGWRPTI